MSENTRIFLQMAAVVLGGLALLFTIPIWGLPYLAWRMISKGGAR